jgi:hypothetical protein
MQDCGRGGERNYTTSHCLEPIPSFPRQRESTNTSTSKGTEMLKTSVALDSRLRGSDGVGMSQGH